MSERETIGGNGGPPLDEAPADMIRRLGTLMYGPKWIPEVASDVGEAERHFRRKIAGTSPITPRLVLNVRQAAKRQIPRLRRQAEAILARAASLEAELQE